jgi:hypothetical protein
MSMFPTPVPEPSPARRAARAARVPPSVIRGHFGLLTFGVIDIRVYTILLVAIVFFLLGRLSVVITVAEQSRQEAVAEIERTIGFIHRSLNDDTFPEAYRERAESDLEHMTGLLASMDKAAPWHVKLRRRRERAKAS